MASTNGGHSALDGVAAFGVALAGNPQTLANIASQDARDAAIQQLEDALRIETTSLDKPGGVPEAERGRRQREAEFQAQRIARQRRDFQAELEISRTDETNALYAAAMLAIRRVAEEQGMDLVLHDLVYIRPDRDITEAVIERLSKSP